MFCYFLEITGLRVATGNLTDISMFTVTAEDIFLLGVYQLRNLFVETLYSMNEKCTSKPTEGKSNHNTRKNIT
jgi:hypothetical protein